MTIIGQYVGITEGGVEYHAALIDTKESSMARANDYQEGGHHYQSDYQHWDWTEEIDMDYLLAAATKYLTRWRQKGNGVKDLRKAIHYVAKRLENVARLQSRRAHLNMEHIRAETKQFLNLNLQIPVSEHMIFTQLAIWTSRKQLAMAHDMLCDLLAREEQETAAPMPELVVGTEPVPVPTLEPPAEQGYVSPRAG
jgi:hypothetical protein